MIFGINNGTGCNRADRSLTKSRPILPKEIRYEVSRVAHKQYQVLKKLLDSKIVESDVNAMTRGTKENTRCDIRLALYFYLLSDNFAYAKA